MTDAIAIRKKVAELCGYKRLNVYANAGDNPRIGADVPILRGFKKNSWHIIPPYELSIDAIAQAFDDHGLIYRLEKTVRPLSKTVYYTASQEGYYTIQKDENNKKEFAADTAAKALCYLFIHAMESSLGFNPLKA